MEATEEAEATEMSTFTETKMTAEMVRVAQRMRMRSPKASYEEIAEVLGVGSSTVRRHLDPRAAKQATEYNHARRKPQQLPAERKIGHMFPWEGVE